MVVGSRLFSGPIRTPKRASQQEGVQIKRSIHLLFRFSSHHAGETHWIVVESFNYSVSCKFLRCVQSSHSVRVSWFFLVSSQLMIGPVFVLVDPVFLFQLEETTHRPPVRSNQQPLPFLRRWLEVLQREAREWRAMGRGVWCSARQHISVDTGHHILWKIWWIILSFSECCCLSVLKILSLKFHSLKFHLPVWL